MNIDEKIKHLRELVGFSQQQLANKLNVSRQVVSKWENGQGIPDLENLKMLSNFFDTTIDSLLNEKEELTGNMIKYNIEINGKNTYKKRYDFALDLIRNLYRKNYKIYTLTELAPDKSRISKISDIFFLMVFGVTDFGVVEWISNLSIWFLVENESKQMLVKTTKECLYIIPLDKPITKKKFKYEDYNLKKVKRISK